MSEIKKVRPRERTAILQSLGSGVVPRIGQQHIQVGRAAEVAALVEDIDRIGEGGSAIRLVIGEYGSGKTFFLQLIRSVALEKRMVCAQADLTPDRRLHATNGQARALYVELMRNLATRSSPEGGALPSIVERFVQSALGDARVSGGSPGALIAERLKSLTELNGGYDFATVIAAYCRGHESADEELQAAAIRWLRGEYATKTDARQALGVRTIVNDANFYDQLKLLARFVRLADYAGLFICLDELVNLFKLPSSQARKSNYEQILRILNDTLAEGDGVGFLLGGTPDFLMDPRKGLYSYEALQSRLAENQFAREGIVDYKGPVLRLANLSPEDLFVLLRNIRDVQASGEDQGALVPDEGIEAFMDHCSKRVGEAHFRTPRSSVKAFVGLLNVIEQNPQLSWSDLVGGVEIEEERNPDLRPLDDAADPDSDEGLATFEL
jgi:BREX system ATP-binding protein BrxC/D